MNTNTLQKKLNDFHKGKASFFIDNFSDIAGNQFPGEFNVSGFHKEILLLSDVSKSIWGIDRCLRVQDKIDDCHSFLFHMAIYAESIDLKEKYSNPFTDDRFKQYQTKILHQFLQILKLFGVKMTNVEATCSDGIVIGGTIEGRDKLLKKKYTFPSDTTSIEFLKNKIKLYPIKSIANIDINASEGSLVGPRLEVAYNGIEIGTIVFNCFKLTQGKLVPINYIFGYAIGIERLAAALSKKAFLDIIPRYKQAKNIILKSTSAAKSSLFKEELTNIVFTSEAIATIPNIVTKKQKERLGELKKSLLKNCLNLSIGEDTTRALINHFKK
ncbi:MAG: hypothetical protein WC682_04255 [Parcubacteria group bacterium]|jgi:hypothetical protein